METTMTIMMSVNQVKGFPPKCNSKKQILQKKIDRMTGLCLNWPEVGVLLARAWLKPSHEGERIRPAVPGSTSGWICRLHSARHRALRVSPVS